MRKRKARQRQHKLIGFKAYTDTDADLLAWWEGIRPGDRSEALRELIRMALGYQMRQPNATYDLPAVQADMVWMREALTDLPGYLEQVIQYVAAHAVVLPENHNPSASQNGAGMSDEAAMRRERRMKKAKW
jgi:hypothetical protein